MMNFTHGDRFYLNQGLILEAGMNVQPSFKKKKCSQVQ